MGVKLKISIFFIFFLFSRITYAQETFPVKETPKQDTASQKQEIKKTPGIKAFVPGLVQLSNKETFKGIAIIGSEVLTIGAGILFWWLSDREYDKYLSLPLGTPQEEFDRHITNSEKYGTMSIISFILSGVVYTYSVLDALLWSKPKQEKTGFYFVPQKEKFTLLFKAKF